MRAIKKPTIKEVWRLKRPAWLKQYFADKLQGHCLELCSPPSFSLLLNYWALRGPTFLYYQYTPISPQGRKASKIKNSQLQIVVRTGSKHPSVESSSFLHRLGFIRFLSSWLYIILNSKLHLSTTLTASPPIHFSEPRVSRLN